MLLPKRKWKDIPGYEGLYQVSNDGKVRSLNYNHTGKAKELKQTFNKEKYKNVCLYKDNKKKVLNVHRLVAIAFIENPQNKPQVNHINENKADNRVENLEWTTAKENMNHGTRNERAAEKLKGIKSPRARKIMCLNNGMIFDCIKYAMEWCGLKSRGDIGRQIKGKRKTAGKDPVTGEKLQWKYIE